MAAKSCGGVRGGSGGTSWPRRQRRTTVIFPSGAEKLEIQYCPCCDPGSPEALAAKLREVKNTELRAGFCLTGPHREDLEILIGRPAGKNLWQPGPAAQCGAEHEVGGSQACGEVGEHPVMLLDDVLSELDDARQTYLLTRIEDKQTFVTTCDSAAFARTNGKLPCGPRNRAGGLRFCFTGDFVPFF